MEPVAKMKSGVGCCLLKKKCSYLPPGKAYHEREREMFIAFLREGQGHKHIRLVTCWVA